MTKEEIKEYEKEKNKKEKKLAIVGVVGYVLLFLFSLILLSFFFVIINVYIHIDKYNGLVDVAMINKTVKNFIFWLFFILTLGSISICIWRCVMCSKKIYRINIEQKCGY